jgi:hypothetical protein
MPAQKAIFILVTVKFFSVVLHYTERALKIYGLVFVHINYNKYQEYRDKPAQEVILILVTVKSFSVVFHYTERALKKWTFPCTHINYKSIC